MLDSAPAIKVVGIYLGCSKVRPGMEHTLTPAEKKKIAKSEDRHSLSLEVDGSFLFKKTTSGDYSVDSDRIVLRPLRFTGLTLEAMEAAALENGRAFGLRWLFDPIVLLIVGDKLEAAHSGGVVYVEYSRQAE